MFEKQDASNFAIINGQDRNAWKTVANMLTRGISLGIGRWDRQGWRFRAATARAQRESEARYFYWRGKNENARRTRLFFFFQAEDGIRDHCVTGVQTCALPIWGTDRSLESRSCSLPGVSS